MDDVRTLSEALWSGTATTEDMRSLFLFRGLTELRPGLGFIGGFGNVSVVATTDGLVLVDTGSPLTVNMVESAVRGFRAADVRTVIYTHGHVDHVMGTEAFEGGGRPPLRVIAHRAVAERFDRYKLTAGYNGIINERQFGIAGLRWPTSYRYPDTVYDDALEVRVGDTRLELRHDRGETDDHTWVWLPDHGAIATGDLFIWASPNCGNPQKAQRYPREWAAALRKMMALDAEVILPGHGPPIEGAARVRQALDETAELLETLVDQTLRAMNRGATLDEVLAEVCAPPALTSRPYLRPSYDEPTFIVRNLWRLYGGWWDGDPAQLKPAPTGALAGEVAALAGGADSLVARARQLSEAGQDALACQLVRWAKLAAPDDEGVARAYAETFETRAGRETSLMAQGIFRDAARRARGDGE